MVDLDPQGDGTWICNKWCAKVALKSVDLKSSKKYIAISQLLFAMQADTMAEKEPESLGFWFFIRKN